MAAAAAGMVGGTAPGSISSARKSPSPDIILFCNPHVGSKLMNQTVIGVCKMKTCLGPVSQKAVFLLAAAQLHGISAFYIKTHRSSRKEGNTSVMICIIFPQVEIQ